MRGARPEITGGASPATAILLVARVDLALMFLVVFDMVAKPFNWD